MYDKAYLRETYALDTDALQCKIQATKNHRAFVSEQKSSLLTRRQMIENGFYGATTSIPFGFGITHLPILPDHDILSLMLPDARYEYALRVREEALAGTRNKMAYYGRLSGKDILRTDILSMHIEKIEAWFAAEEARYVDYLKTAGFRKRRGVRITLREIREAISIFLNEKPLARAIAAAINS